MAKKILIGVSGGVAAYKVAVLTSRLAQAGHNIQVVMTEAAEHFVGSATFAALSGRSVAQNMFDPGYPLGPHIELAREFEILCIAPATANTIGKCATGIADDLLTSLYLCFQGPVLMAPAMNCEMWESPSVQRNIARLVQDGVAMVGPDQGWLSCRVQGMGRMAEPEEIFEALIADAPKTA